MCGINGILKFNGENVVEEKLLQMRDMLEHRGPDDAGFWLNGPVGLAHRRLSILDLSEAGHQPFCSEDGRFVMVYNGEVYNFLELRDDLTKFGYKCKSNSDTEVVLKLYIHLGPAMLEKLNGMFSIVIWDQTKKELFIARDRAGVKPLVYSLDSTGFYFASEHKALIKYGIDPTIDEEGINEIIGFRYISGANTIFKNIKKLLPGHYIKVSLNGEFNITRWWNLGEKILNHKPIQNPAAWFEETFDSSVKYRMVSDVNVGILLSAGLDSSTVAKSLQNQNFNKIETFNVAFKNKNHDESGLAEELSSKLGFGFNKLFLDGSDLYEAIVNATYHYDEPLVHMNDPQILSISKMAKSKVSVLLSGEGADELMGGYVRYKVFQYKIFWPALKLLLKFTNKFSSNRRFEKLNEYLKIGNVEMMQLMNGNSLFLDSLIEEYKLFGLNFFPEYRLQVLKEAQKVYPNNELRQLLYLDQHTYLQSLNDRNDRATMGASIECREPFLDFRLMEGLGTLSDQWLFKGKRSKYILSSTIGSKLPDFIRNFKKVGFSVPWTDYIKENPKLRQVLDDLPSCELFKIGVLGNLDIPKLRDEFIKFDKHKAIITQLVFSSIWYNTYFERIKNNQ